MNPRILIVDEHEIVREGIRNLLARSGKNWEVCGEACNASDAWQASLSHGLAFACNSLVFLDFLTN